MTYPGGKNGAGVYQRIINYIPPHQTYIEGFLGSGAILRQKRPARINIAIDRSHKAIVLARGLAGNRKDIDYHQVCIFQFLKGHNCDRETLIYLDPPYVLDTRKSGELYRHELSDDDHQLLLSIICALDCMVMISGYRSRMYDQALKGWHRIDYKTMTRRGMVDESLWMNFKPPNELHDYSFLGSDYRERERIKRKKKRWQNKFTNMDRLERLAVMEALQNV